MRKELVLLLAGISLITGCGGGGGGGGGSTTSLPATYTGKTTQATVTTANAKALSTAAYNAGALATTLDSIQKVAANSSAFQSPLILDVADIIENSAIAAQQPKSTLKTVESVVNSQNTVNGYSGSYSYNFNIDNVSGAFSGTETFAHYQAASGSLTMNGTVTISGVVNAATSTFSSLNMTMSALNVTVTGSDLTLAGNLSASISGPTKTVSFTLATTDNVAHLTNLAYNYTLTLTGTLLTFGGTYYDPGEGYLVISTVTPLTVASITATPTDGQLLFTGSNNTKARLTFTSGGSITIDADTTGNGTFVVVP